MIALIIALLQVSVQTKILQKPELLGFRDFVTGHNGEYRDKLDSFKCRNVGRVWSDGKCQPR